METDWGTGRTRADPEAYGLVASIAGRYGAVRYFHGRMVQAAKPREALADIRAAEQTGFRDPMVYRDELSLAGRLGEPSLAAAARAARAAWSGP